MTSRGLTQVYLRRDPYGPDQSRVCLGLMYYVVLYATVELANINRIKQKHQSNNVYEIDNVIHFRKVLDIVKKMRNNQKILKIRIFCFAGVHMF